MLGGVSGGGAGFEADGVTGTEGPTDFSVDWDWDILLHRFLFLTGLDGTGWTVVAVVVVGAGVVAAGVDDGKF